MSESIKAALGAGIFMLAIGGIGCHLVGLEYPEAGQAIAAGTGIASWICVEIYYRRRKAHKPADLGKE